MNKQFSKLLRHRSRRKKGDTALLAAQLAPLEEQDKRAAEKQTVNNQAVGNSNGLAGSIIVDNDSVNIPQGIGEGRAERTFLRVEPVVLVILVIMLAFIAFIAWKISLMPAQ